MNICSSVCIAVSVMSVQVASARLFPGNQPAQSVDKAVPALEKENPNKKVDAPKGDVSNPDRERQKEVLEKLLKELERSPRSFNYLRTVGFKETDQEFEKLIITNKDRLRSIRIIRRDEKGVRQIPGWPGVALADRYKAPKQ